ncbi:MAG: response regulator transcription factor [Saprospiraceae bacterium]|nr:response regulator transcription factor [Saprospiraceae bacterium]
MKIAIVDDIKVHRDDIRYKLLEHCKDITVIWEAEDIPAARQLLMDNPPDLALLDIQMDSDHSTIFPLLEELQHLDRLHFDIIFITAYGYDSYMLQAIELAALKYLTKPVNGELLRDAVEKARQRKNSREWLMRQIQMLLEKTHQPNVPLDTIALPLISAEPEIEWVKLKDICFIETCSNAHHTLVHLKRRPKPLQCEYALPRFRDLLAMPRPFFQVHQSYIVNLESVKTFQPKTRKLVFFDNDQVVTASENGAERLKAQEWRHGDSNLEYHKRSLDWVWRALRGK